MNVNATDAWQRTALHKAAWRGHTKTCITLLSHGANLLQPDQFMKTAHDLARANDNTDCVNILRAWAVANAARAALQEFTMVTAPPGP